jgi:hypothetical protein
MTFKSAANGGDIEIKHNLAGDLDFVLNNEYPGESCQVVLISKNTGAANASGVVFAASDTWGGGGNIQNNKLTVLGGAGLVLQTNGATSDIKVVSPNIFQIQTNNTTFYVDTPPIFYATKDQKIGISTSVPSSTLDVAGTSTFGINSGSTHRFTGSVNISNNLNLLNLTGSSTRYAVVDLNGNVSVGDTYSSQGAVNSGSGNVVIDTISSSSFDMCHWKYIVLSGSNRRTGELMSTWYNGNIEFVDYSTNDIGETSDALLLAEISGSNINLTLNSTYIWTVKTMKTLI